MARKDEAKIKFTAETSEFNSAIESTKSKITELKSALRLNSAEMDNTGASTDKLQKRQELLQTELEQTKIKEELLNAKLQKAIEIYGENSKEAQKFQTQLNNTKIAEEKIKTAISDVTSKIEENNAATTDLDSALKTTQSKITELNSALRLNSAEIESTGATTDKLQKRHELLQSELEQTGIKEELLNAKLQKANEVYGQNSNEAKELQTQLNNTKTAEEKIKIAISDTTSKMEENRRAAAESKTASSQLNEKIEEQQSRLQELRQRYIDVTLESGNHSKEARELKKEMKELNNELQDNQAKLSEVKGNADNFTSALDDCGNAATTASNGGFTIFKGALADLAANAIRGCIDACKELGSSVLESGMSFESSMSKVQALSGASAEEMEQLKLKAQEMGKNTKFTATESADAFGYMALAGWDTSQMLDGISGILDLAAASEMDLATASDIVTDNLSAFGLTAADSGRLVDQMSYAMSHSNTDTAQLGEAWKNCAATSTQLGYSLEDTTAALMVMADSGIKGGEAGTALSSIMTRLGNNVSDCRTMLESYGIEVYDSEGNVKSLSSILGAMKEVWAGLTDEQKSNLSYIVAGKTAQSELMTVLGESTGSFEEYAAGLSNCSGSASEMSSTMLDNLSGDVTLMESAFDGLKQTIFEDADGPLREVTQTVTNELIPAAEDMYGDLKEGIGWMKEHKDLISGIAIVIGALATGITAYNVVTGVKTAMEAANVTTLGGLVKAQLASNAAFMASPITWVVAGITALVAGFIYLWNNVDWFRQMWLDAWDGITGFFSDAKDNITNGLDTVEDFFTGLPGKVQGGLDSFKTSVSDSFFDTYSRVDELTNGGLSTVVSMTQQNLSSMKSAYDEAGGGIQGIAAGMMAGAQGIFSDGYDILNGLTGGKLGNVVNTAKNELSNMKSAYNEAGGGIKGITAGMMAGVQGYFRTGFTAINELTGGKLGNLLSTVSGKMQSVHDKFYGIVEKIKGIFNFDFKWPAIKMPSIDVTWKKEGTLAKAAQFLGFEGLPSFNVKWNASGAILTKPTIFGMAGGQFQGGGEDGPEAVLPIHILEGFISNAMMNFIGAIPQIDYNRLGEAVADALSKNPTKIVIGEREFGRVVSDLI